MPIERSRDQIDEKHREDEDLARIRASEAATSATPVTSMWTVLMLDCKLCGNGIPIRVNALDPVDVRDRAIQLHQFMVAHVRRQHPDYGSGRLTKRIVGRILGSGCDVEFDLGRTPKSDQSLHITSEPDDLWGSDGIVIKDIRGSVVRMPFAFDVRDRPYRFFAEVVD